MINYGPTIAVHRSLDGQPERQAQLGRDLVDLAGRFALPGDHGQGGDGPMIMDWEYLLLTAVIV